VALRRTTRLRSTNALFLYERGGLGIVPRSPITLRFTGRFLLRSSLNGLIDEDRFGFYSGVRLLG